VGTATKLSEKHRAFIEQQKMFFVATAAREGRVNLSPKGMDTLRITEENQIVWLSLSGSGNETAAHLLDTPRMTLMFCAFEGDALILRTYGTARAIHPHDVEWPDYLSLFPALAGTRQIYIQDIDMVQTSCGTGVPEMQFSRSRGETELVPYYNDMGVDGVQAYWRRKNTKSIDGLPTGILPE